ncbi:MAG: GntP family permease [Saprospiraceae bacterium]|jgi:GntP family gluconate:H+ symporter
MVFNLLILVSLLLLLIFSISKWKIHPFIALILTAAVLGISLGMGGAKTIEVLLQGFSETIRWIAIVIILGAFIGEVLQETGGAFRIANRVVDTVGLKKLPWAMGFTGYLISIPVFVDVAYILLQPVTESLASKSKKPVLYIGLALTAGLTVSHTLIPPTPGPMAVASLLNLDLGKMLLINMIVAIFAMTGGVLFVINYVQNSWLDYDKNLPQSTEIDDIKTKATTQSNNVIFDMLPIIFPILLIGAGSFLKFDQTTLTGSFFSFIGLPVVAVFIGALIAIFQLRNNDKRSTINRLVEQSIVKSALVIMITGAGGALGFVIKQSGIQNDILEIFTVYPFLGFMLPFLVAAILTTSTGSITVSLVGTASMIAPMVESLPMSPEITAALIGCGSFCVFHANSSFFWLLNKLHDAPPKILYKTYSVQSLVMGFSGLIGVFLLKLLGF